MQDKIYSFMANTGLKGMHPFSQFLFTLFIIVACFLFFMIVAIVVAIPVFHIDLLDMPSISSIGDPETIKFLKFFQLVQGIGLFIVPALILGWLFHGNVAGYLSLNKKVRFSSVLLVILLVFIANPGINFLGAINAKMVLPTWLSGFETWMKNAEENAAVLTEAFLNVKTIPGLMFNLLMIAVVPAIGEELLFRGVLQKIFIKWTKNIHVGIWITAILFSAFHMQFYGFLPRMVLGLLFGYLLVWSGSMWLPIIAHFINNAAAVVAMYLVSQNKLTPAVEDFGATPESIYAALFSVVLVGLIMSVFWKQYRLKLE